MNKQQQIATLNTKIDKLATLHRQILDNDDQWFSNWGRYRSTSLHEMIVPLLKEWAKLSKS